MSEQNYYLCYGCMEDPESIPCSMIVNQSPAIPTECPFSVRNYKGPNCFTPHWIEVNVAKYKKEILE